jgi:vacuole morphology and inheritance protein 14
MIYLMHYARWVFVSFSFPSLPIFTDVGVPQLASDSEPPVKNGAELLDRLVKDIVAESAPYYVSVLQTPETNIQDLESTQEPEKVSTDPPTAFSLAKFIPLLEERIHVISPFTRTFLVSWLTLLDTIPDLELVSYLPSFLGGLINFLGDPNKDVNVATQGLLERLLSEIKRIARIKKGIAESKKSHESNNRPSAESEVASLTTGQSAEIEGNDNAIMDSESDISNEDQDINNDGDWVPGQDASIDYPKILEILVAFVVASYGQ